FVVAYGSMGGAERLWWLLRHFGHDDCAVLAGGIESWLGPLSAGEEDIDAAVFTPRERAGDTIAVEEIARRLGDPELVLVDARLEPRWRGEQNPIDNVPGRIPGALNAPWNEAVPELPEGEVVAYGGSGVRGGGVFPYCGSGVRAPVPVHRLALAGRGVRLYPGSWSQWETLDLPIERS